MIRHNNYEKKDLYEIMETFSHYQKVNFAFYCSKEVEPFTNDQRVIDCNLIVERWLKGDKTVDLEIARTNVWDTWDNSGAAASAAYYAANAAASTVVTATADVYAASAVASATASAKSYKLCPNDREQRNIAFTQFYKEYNQIAQNWLSHWIIPNFPKDEPDFPIFDFLIDMNFISSLLPKKEDYYYLNLNGFDIKHHNEAELLKLIDTTHIKTILRRIINNDSAQQL